MGRKPLRLRLEQLDARRQMLAARLAKQERSEDTRRKILIGALVLNRIYKAPDKDLSRRLCDWLRAELPGFLPREGDRALFSDILAPDPATGSETDAKNEGDASA